MNAMEKLILNEAQNGISFSETPFLDIANKLNITEDQVIDALNSLKEKGYIRRFGGVVNVNNIGIKSTLIGMKVPNKYIDDVANHISSYKEVTHNYSRTDEYNLWFTIMAKSQQRIQDIIDEITEKTGIKEIIDLPSVKKYRTKVYFKMD
ncbi:Lrp/AsnC ligand binding domain-containing protein [Clostridiisalibacter paucivorans]|uniref:Lrp/AsnC ligand binding domain-containing protein n=1 Tax=Clostridiisalibacter paucivorans TaxID=408753 RepID=UPI00047B416C|nr:Lrp/AsnC family transcriptional regulator [Clostridiisalibacter paucivorans]